MEIRVESLGLPWVLEYLMELSLWGLSPPGEPGRLCITCVLRETMGFLCPQNPGWAQVNGLQSPFQIPHSNPLGRWFCVTAKL